jgi:hypothetical protein
MIAFALGFFVRGKSSSSLLQELPHFAVVPYSRDENLCVMFWLDMSAARAA